jgi:hypothetical protein
MCSQQIHGTSRPARKLIALDANLGMWQLRQLFYKTMPTAGVTVQKLPPFGLCKGFACSKKSLQNIIYYFKQ